MLAYCLSPLFPSLLLFISVRRHTLNTSSAYSLTASLPFSLPYCYSSLFDDTLSILPRHTRLLPLSPFPFPTAIRLCSTTHSQYFLVPHSTYSLTASPPPSLLPLPSPSSLFVDALSISPHISLNNWKSLTLSDGSGRSRKIRVHCYVFGTKKRTGARDLDRRGQDENDGNHG